MSRKKTKEDQESRAYSWALLATLILLVSLIAQTPSRVLAHFLPPAAKPMVLSWGGTVWSGQVNWQYHNLQGQSRWRLDPSAWLRLSLGVKWELLTSGSSISGRASTGFGKWSVSKVQGSLSGNDLKGIMTNWDIPGGSPLSIKSLELLRKGQSWQGSAARLEWQGGNMQYQMEGQKQAMALPPVALEMRGQEGRLQLELSEQAGGAALATFVLNGDMLESRLRQRLLLHAAGYRGVAEPDAFVVTASQPLSGL